MSDLSFLQGLINAAPDNGTIEIPAGDYSIADTLIIPNSKSVRPGRRRSLLTAGVGDAYDQDYIKLTWTGAAGVPMVRVTNSYQSTIEGLELVGDTTNTPSHGIALQTTLAPTVTNSQVTLRRIRAGWGLSAVADGMGGFEHYLTVGIGTEGEDTGNDYHAIDQCYLRLCETAIRQLHGQNTSWTVRDTVCTVSTYNIRTASNLKLDTCFLSVASDCDIYVPAADSVNRRNITLLEVGSEQSATFLKADANCNIKGTGVAWNDSDLYGTGANQSFIELTGNNPQHVEFDLLRITRGGTKTECDVVVKPASSGNARKTLVLRGQHTLDLAYDYAATSVASTHRVHIVRDLIDGSGVHEQTDVIVRRQEIEPSETTHDLPVEVVRMGERKSNGVGATQVRTFEVDHTFSGPGSSGVYDISGALPAGHLVLGVTARRDFATPLSPGTSSLRIGTASAPDKWGDGAIAAGVSNVSDSDDFVDGSPLWVGSDTDLRVTKLEAGSPTGSLDGVRVHFTVHAIRCVGGPI